MAKVVRGRRPKAEVQEEFAGMLQEVVDGREKVSMKEELALQMQEAEIRSAVSGIAVEAIVHKMANLNVEISKALAHLSEKMSSEILLLNQVQAAIVMEKQNLEQLHKVDIALTALDQLVEDHQAKKGAFEEEMAGMRKTWEEEQAGRERDVAEGEAKLKQAREREKEEYEYKKGLERKKEKDAYEEACRKRDKEVEEKQEALEKAWQGREEALLMREKMVDEMQRSIDGFPARLTEEKEKMRRETIEAVEQRFAQEILVLQKDKETEKLLAGMKISSLEETLSRQSAQFELLQKQLEEAKREVKEIAEKAIEGASGAKALSHINQIAIEQAKHRASTN